MPSLQKTKILFANSSEVPTVTHNRLLLGQLNLMPTLLGLQGIDKPKSVGKRDLSRLILHGKEDALKSAPLFYHGKDGYWGAATKDCAYFQFADTLKEMEIYPSSALNNAQLRTEMTALTDTWLNYFGDQHFGYDSLVKVMPINAWKNQHKTYTVPIDELKKLHSKSVMNFHGNLKYD